MASETTGGLTLRQGAKRRLGFSPTTLGGDKGFVSVGFIEALLGRGIEPHIAVDPRGRQPAHARVRTRARGLGYRLSQRARKKIEELLGEGKDGHGLRRVRQESYLDRLGSEPEALGQPAQSAGAADVTMMCTTVPAASDRTAAGRTRRSQPGLIPHVSDKRELDPRFVSCLLEGGD